MRRLHPDFAVALDGLDLRRDLSSEVVALLADTVERERVVVVPGQRLRPAAQLRVGAALGTLYGRRRSRLGRWYRPELRYEGAGEAQAAFFNEQWHADLSWAPEGDPVTLLHALHVDDSSAPTAFADMVGAHRSLDEATRRTVAGWRAHHHVDVSRAVRYDAAPPPRRRRPPLRRLADAVGGELHGLRPSLRARTVAKPEPPGALHDVVHTDAGGRTSLRIGDHAWSLAGKDEREGVTLLDELQRSVLQPAVIYEHRWQPGDLVLFDNRAVLHRRAPGADPSAPRLLRRCVVWRREDGSTRTT